MNSLANQDNTIDVTWGIGNTGQIVPFKEFPITASLINPGGSILSDFYLRISSRWEWKSDFECENDFGFIEAWSDTEIIKMDNHFPNFIIPNYHFKEEGDYTLSVFYIEDRKVKAQYYDRLNFNDYRESEYLDSIDKDWEENRPVVIVYNFIWI